ncbi:MAG: glycosyltransferase, partial [Chloroflexi bacterium]|nr:glycosyltransferase [Chloroflexota bacterium]
ASLRGDWELRVLGRGPESEKLQTLTRELNIQNKISFDRPRPSTEMPTFYQQLDVLVVPSRTRANWQEQFGRVLIEAMACGIAVIGSNCGEIPNVIGDAGIVVPENDPAALLAALEILRDARARRAELGARGRARVLKYFTHQRIAAETYAIYQKILSR